MTGQLTLQELQTIKRQLQRTWEKHGICTSCRHTQHTSDKEWHYRDCEYVESLDAIQRVIPNELLIPPVKG